MDPLSPHLLTVSLFLWNFQLFSQVLTAPTGINYPNINALLTQLTQPGGLHPTQLHTRNRVLNQRAPQNAVNQQRSAFPFLKKQIPIIPANWNLFNMNELVDLGSIDVNSIADADFSFDKIHQICQLLERGTSVLLKPTGEPLVNDDAITTRPPSNRDRSRVRRSLQSANPQSDPMASRCQLLRAFSHLDPQNPSHIGGLLEGLTIAGAQGPAAPLANFLVGPGLRYEHQVPRDAITTGSDLPGQEVPQHLSQDSTSANEAVPNISSQLAETPPKGMMDLGHISGLNSLDGAALRWRQRQRSRRPPRQQMDRLFVGPDPDPYNQRRDTGGQWKPGFFGFGIPRIQGQEVIESLYPSKFLPSPGRLIHGADVTQPAKEVVSGFLNTLLNGLFLPR